MTYNAMEGGYEQTFGINELLTKFPQIQTDITKGMGKIGSDESLPYQVLNILADRYIEDLHRRHNMEVGGPFEVDNDNELVARFAITLGQSKVSIVLGSAEMNYKPNFAGLGSVMFPKNVTVSGQDDKAVREIFLILEEIIENSSERELLETALSNQTKYGHFVDQP